jgi:hypothetical protein
VRSPEKIMAKPSSSRSLIGRAPALGSIFLAGCLLAGSLSSTGCAPVSTSNQPPGGPTTPDGEPVTYELKKPTLTTISPNDVALGDEVRVFGQDFIDPPHGELKLHLRGTFTASNGTQTRVDNLAVPLTYLGPGQAKFTFGPNVIFSPTGNELGAFEGNFQVVSYLTSAAYNAEPGDMEISDAQHLAMSAQPSILIDQFRSVDEACDPVTTATIAETNMAIGVRALGMSPATSANPITWRFSFTSPGLTASYVENKVYGTWPYTGSGSPTPAAPTGNGNFSFSFKTTSGINAVVDPEHHEQIVNVSPPVTVSQAAQNQTTVKLARLATGEHNQLGSTTFTVVVQATKPDGTTIARTINFPVWSRIEMPPFTGQEQLRERFAPQMTDTGCVSGGNLPLEYQYSEGTSESKMRTVNMSWNQMYTKAFNLSEGVQLGFGLPVVGGVGVNLNANNMWQWSQTFGVDNSVTTSTETHRNDTGSVTIYPGQFAVSWKQTERLERRVPVIYHSACGVTGPIGEAVLTDYRWNLSINRGPTCDPPPASNLPPAATF